MNVHFTPRHCLASNRIRRSISISISIFVTITLSLATGALILAGALLYPGAPAIVAQTPDAHSATYVVTSLNDAPVEPGTPTCGATCTLRDAVRTAAENPGHDTIVFAEGLTGVLTLVNVLTINSEVTIVGPGADLLTVAVAGSDAFNRRVMLITSTTVTLRGLTIQRTGSGRGGGIQNGGALTIENSTIKDSSYNGPGGAIYNSSTASLTLIDSIISNNHATTQGGGIFNLTGPVTVTRTSFVGNRATGASREGSAIRNSGGTLTIVDSEFTENLSIAAVANLAGGTARVSGTTFADNLTGGLYNSGANSTLEVVDSAFLRNSSSAITNGDSITHEPTTVVTVTASTFVENRASGGGAILNRLGGQVTLVSSTLEGNLATFAGGGAISNDRLARITVQDSAIVGNRAIEGATFGGGIHNTGGGVFVLERSTVSGNRADEVTTGIINNFDSCGGIHNEGSGSSTPTPTHMTIRNSTISGNLALEDGGICVRSGTGAGKSVVEIEYSTIAYNRVLAPNEDDGGGGIFILGGDVTLTGVILANNTRGDGGELDNLFQHVTAPGTITSNGYNLSDSTVAGFGANDVAQTPAGLAPLAGYGGPTHTHALFKGSAAIDVANHAACPATDQRGTTRPRDGNGDSSAICDIGAFESDEELEEPAAMHFMHLPAVRS